ncbi:MAG: hypothetical protein MUO82_04475 [Candidatus Thermoplasmatota archaeon]|nr:hypothetical protein [Candidatus Thermoplasmatota archaeon]
MSYIDFLKSYGIIDSQGHRSSVCRYFTCFDCGLSSFSKVDTRCCKHCGSHNLKEWKSIFYEGFGYGKI